MSRQSALEDGKVVSLMNRPPLPPKGDIPGTHLCVEYESTIVRPEGLNQ
jgi:hypothetical protein